MEKLTNWRAKRSGGRITILATDSAGTERRIPNIDTIVVRNPYPVATDKDGRQYALAVV